MRYYSILFCFAIVLVSGVLFSACSRDEDHNSNEQQEPTTTETAVTPTPPVPETGIPTPVHPGEGNDGMPLVEDPNLEEETTPQDDSERQVPQTRFWSAEVKRAIAAAIDREAIVDRVFEGRADSAYHTVPFDYPASSDPFFQKFGARDLRLAIDILTEEGYTEDNPLVVDILAPLQHAFIKEKNILTVLKEQLEGTSLIMVNLHTHEWEEYLRLIEAAEMSLFIHHWLPYFADPDNWLSPFASCALSQNFGIHYCSAIMDEMLHMAAVASDGEQRTMLYDEIGDMFAFDPPVIPLYWELEPLVYREGIQGIEFGSMRELNLWTLQFDDNVVPAGEEGEALIIGTTLGLDSLDLFNPSNLMIRDIFYNTTLPLLRFLSETYELAPAAAEDFPISNEDNTEYTFVLREDLAFSDGTPVRSQDFVRSWEHLKDLDNNHAGMYWRYVENIHTPDDKTLVFQLTGSNAFFPALAATSVFTPMHPQYSAQDWGSLQNNATGPYMVSSYSPGEQIVLEVNPAYIGNEIAAVGNITIRYFFDSASLVNAVEAGEIDLAWRHITLDDAFILEEVNGVIVEMVETHTLRFLAFNHQYGLQEDFHPGTGDE
jgi:peptide/nickel transport system substrate-binding protein